MDKWRRLENIAASMPQEAWTRRPQGGAIYKCEDGYRVYYWGFLKGYKYKYLREAMAVVDALNKLGELKPGLSKEYINEHFGFEKEQQHVCTN